MLTLRQHLAQRHNIELRIIAQNQGIMLDDEGATGDALSALIEQMLRPEQVRAVWEDLPEEARRTLAAMRHKQWVMPVATFERYFGQLRRMGPGRLQTERPWKSPTGPGEVLWHLGWIMRGFQKRTEGLVDCIIVPPELRPLLPLDEITPTPQPRLPTPQSTPATGRELGELLLDDLGTMLAYVQNHQVWLRQGDRWRMKDLQRLLPRLRLSRIRQQPLEAGGPLHLIFYSAKKLGLLKARNRKLGFGPGLRPWLERSRPQQMLSLFQSWRQGEDWNDLCLTPGLRCQEGAWRNDPALARRALLQRLAAAQPGVWYELDAMIALIYDDTPDFQRPDGLYDTWYIQNEAGDFLRGFKHWPAVEGRLIRYIWQGPLFWLGVAALDARGEQWSLTEQGEAFLRGEPGLAADTGPALQVERDFSIVLAPHIGLWDRLRVALFAFWQASEPAYRYRITRRGVQRAQQRGVSRQRIIDFLLRASDGKLPDNVRKALERPN